MAHRTVKGELAAKDRKAQAKEHVGELGDRGEGQQALHVLLRQVHKEAKEHGDHGVDDGDPAHNLGHVTGRDERTREHAHADLNHRGAVQVGRDRRGGLHGRRQPHVHGDLRGLCPSGKEHHQQHRGLNGRIEARDSRNGKRTGVGKEYRGAQVQAKGSDMRDDKGLHTGLFGRGRHVVADKAPGAGTRDLKEHELAHERGAVHQAGHGADECGQVGIETTTRKVGMLAVVLAHVRD